MNDLPRRDRESVGAAMARGIAHGALAGLLCVVVTMIIGGILT